MNRKVAGLFMAIFIAQIFVVYTQTNFWPVNPYLMFSGYRPLSDVKGFRLWGEDASGNRHYLQIKPVKWQFFKYEKDENALKEIVRNEAAKIPNKFPKYILASCMFKEKRNHIAVEEKRLVEVEIK